MNCKRPWFLVALVLLVPTIAWAANSCDYASMKGEEITFRQSYPGGEQYGYQLLYSKPDNTARHLAYEPYVGKKGKIQDGVIKDKYGISEFKQVVLENCENVYVNLVSHEMPNDVYRSLDVDVAKLLIGKTIWIDQTYGVYPLELVTLDSNVSYPLSNVEPVTVTDLYMPGIGHARGAAPFYLKVKKASGEEGYLPFNTIYFYPENPIPAGTPAKIVEAIKGQKIMLGMTAKQVELSWGKPEDVNRSVGSWGVHEQWVYGRQYVYLENGKVSSYQD
jgi:hypothetical protein